MLQAMEIIMIDFDRYGKRRELNDLLAYDKFVLFGAGGASYLTVNYLKQRCHKHVICFIDNNPNKWNTSHLGIDILSPAKLKALIDNNTAIIISSVSFQSEIAKQLTTGIGIEPDRIFPYINELVAKHYDNYYLFSNAHLLDDLLDKLADQDSREYFEHIIAFRWTLNPLYLLPNPRMRSSRVRQ
jgi:FlaA1/EpsC-like NDP-sugar epimerase